MDIKTRIAACRQGLLRGVPGRDENITIFRGVPFAQPPVGELRWRAPQPPVPWWGIRPATEDGAAPAQKSGAFLPATSFDDVYISEDCLYLNITTPAQRGDEKLPVFFWIFGGGLQGGYGSDPTFDGETFAKNGVILVTINYRVGLMGYYCHPDMDEENGRGNFGLLDQIAALRWVKENIAAFGGDPDRITVGGQSAGGMSTINLMCSPESRDLMAQAIVESGDLFMVGKADPFETAAEKGRRFAEHMGVSSLEELRQLPLTQLVTADHDAYIDFIGSFCSHVIDGKVLVEPQPVSLLSGRASRVPMIILTAWEEGFGSYDQALTWLGEHGKEASELFNASTEEEKKAAGFELGRRIMFGRNCAWAKIRSEKYGLPTYQALQAKGMIVNGSRMGAIHSSELGYVFHSLELTFGNPDWSFLQAELTDEDRNLSDIVSSYWANFIRTGDPNGAGLPRWPEKQENAHILLDAAVEARPDDCDEALGKICAYARDVLESGKILLQN